MNVMIKHKRKERKEQTIEVT